jgi:hypothetical protein
MEKESNQTEREFVYRAIIKKSYSPVLVGLSNPNYTPIDQILRT